MRIGVFGSGALGSLFAARLAGVADVVLVGTWAAQLAIVAARGVQLTLPNGGTRLARPAVARPEAAPAVDLALVLVKSYQTARTAAHVAALLQPAGCAVTLQNGLGNDTLLAETVGAARVVVGTTALGATLTEPGAVRQAGREPVILPSGGPPTLAELATLLQASGLEVVRRRDIERLVWEKLAVNTAINPPTALLGIDNGALAAQPAGRALLRAVARETAWVAQAAGIPLDVEAAAARAIAVARATADNRSSMRQDLDRGGPTEIEAICGAVVARAATLEVAAAHNALYEALLTVAARDGRDAALRLLTGRCAAADPGAQLLCEFLRVMERATP